MDEDFLLVYRLLGLKRFEEDRTRTPTVQVIRELRADPEALEREKSFWEHLFRTDERPAGELLLRALMSAATYLSEVLQGPVPVLLGREDVQALRDGAGQPGAAAGRLLQRMVNSAAERAQADRNERLMEKIDELFAGRGAGAGPRFLDTDQVAARVGLSAKTVRRLFVQGQLIGRKVGGNQWRTTPDDLERSPYMAQVRRTKRAALE
ncbi:MAG: helix-turn-helix domain-containing protein [Planctomycetota bacterium]